MIALGHYHPVTADFMPPGLLPFYWAYLTALMLVSFLGSFAVLWKFGDARRVWTKPLVLCWVAQLTLWGLSLTVGLTWRYLH
jgi:hypothetical protein